MAEGKWIRDLTASTPLVDAARRVLSVRLQVVRDCLDRSLREADKDPEDIHQLRVATRRAGAAVEIFALCLPEEQYTAIRHYLRQIRRSAGEARDWDVFLDSLSGEEQKTKRRHRAGFDFLMGYALAQRVGAHARLEEASPDFLAAFERLFAETISAVRQPQAEAAAQTLLDLSGSVLSLAKELDQAAAGDLTDYDRLHQVRILGKRLRYAMEVFADCFAPAFKEELYPAVDDMQEILGQANDSHVASERLAKMRDQIRETLPDDWKRYKPGIEGFLKHHQQSLSEERRRFCRWWERWQILGGAAAFTALQKKAESQESGIRGQESV